MNRPTKIIIALAFLGASATSVLAASAWEQNHPRRDQVNERLVFQNWRINREFREGELTRFQAYRLHNEDHVVRREERAMAWLSHGHISGAEQRALNQQENVIGRRIGR
jgi:hypothetical protein